MSRKVSNYDYDDYDDYDDYYDDYDDGDNYSKPVAVKPPSKKTTVPAGGGAKAKGSAPTAKKAPAAGAAPGNTKPAAGKKGSVVSPKVTTSNAVIAATSVKPSPPPPPAVLSIDQFEPPVELMSKMDIEAATIQSPGISLGNTSSKSSISSSSSSNVSANQLNTTVNTAVGAAVTVQTTTVTTGALPSDDEDEATVALSGGGSGGGGGGYLAGEEVHSSNVADDLTIIIVGHVDAGKSTLIGQLLFKLGYVSSQVLRRYTKEATAAGKASFQFAWVMDENSSEREHGVTIDIAEKLVCTPNTRRELRLLDAPGHKDYVPRLLAGLPLADVALLIIPASVGEYESSMSLSAQTREHAILLKASGIAHVVIVVNKMDNTVPPFSVERYEYIVSDLSRFLMDDLHFVSSQLHFLPVSAFTGENILALAKSCPMSSWWKAGEGVNKSAGFFQPSGLTLVQTLEGLSVPHFSSYYKSLRALVVLPPTNISTYGSGGGGGAVAANTVEIYMRVCRGRLRVGSSVGVTCSSSSSNSSSNSSGDSSCSSFKSGDGGIIIRCVVKKLVLIKQEQQQLQHGSSAGTCGAGNAGGTVIGGRVRRIDCKTVFAGQFALVYLQATGVSVNTTTTAAVDTSSASASASCQSPLVVSKTAAHEMLLRTASVAGSVVMKGPDIDLCRPRSLFRCMIRTLPQLASPVIPGSSFTLHTHGYTEEVTCVAKRICSVIKTNAGIGTGVGAGASAGAGAGAVSTAVVVKSVPAGQLAVVELMTSVPVVLEPISQSTTYHHGNSRFVLRYKGQTVATGVCEKQV